MSITPAVSALADRARTLRTLHGTRPLVLPTVWDAWSAQLAVDAGFAALTVGSHPVANSLGVADNEGMTPEQAFAAISRVTASVDVPVSADVESGYGLSPADLVERLLGAGAVGLNVEDTVHSEGGRLRSSQEHAEARRLHPGCPCCGRCGRGAGGRQCPYRFLQGRRRSTAVAR